MRAVRTNRGQNSASGRGGWLGADGVYGVRMVLCKLPRQALYRVFGDFEEMRFDTRFANSTKIRAVRSDSHYNVAMSTSAN